MIKITEVQNGSFRCFFLVVGKFFWFNELFSLNVYPTVLPEKRVLHLQSQLFIMNCTGSKSIIRDQLSHMASINRLHPLLKILMTLMSLKIERKQFHNIYISYGKQL